MEWMYSLDAADKIEVLTRVALVFRRQLSEIRSFNSTKLGERLQINILAETDPHRAQMITTQLRKLRDIAQVEAYAPEGASRLLAMIKVFSTPEKRSQIMQLIEAFHARVLNGTEYWVTILATGTADEIQSLADVLRPYGILEETISGPVFRKPQVSRSDEMSWEAMSLPLKDRAQNPSKPERI